MCQAYLQAGMKGHAAEGLGMANFLTHYRASAIMIFALTYVQ